ncbi:unnamed protein product [Ceratitis capitata]|uniref:(Mediterranean fruit fly) hypothetical protein n=1 Tax=Ceratitis capitata TaxID=7213 RepID=A0A811U6U9_CERCA|nr:unnamed protein product [Ceratitis capitata]
MANTNVVPKYTQLFINNEFVDAVSGKKFPTVNPATGKVIAEIAEGDKADVDLAVAAAKKAFHRNSEWRKLSPTQRSELMLKLCSLMERDKLILASLETQDNGKPLSNSIFAVAAAIDALKYYAGWTDKFTGNTIPAEPYVAQTRKEPIGVVGQIIPWNYPINMLAWKWAPALCVGCTIVMKPAEQTPLTALHAAALAKEAGFPAGVINVITGYGPTAGAAISEHHDIQKVAFTGSGEIGRIIMQAAAKSNLKRVTLELGGKSPLVIFEDVDVDQAVSIAHNAVFPNAGQTCCAGTRTYVHEKIYDEFVKKSVALAKARKLGNPFDATVEQGPQIDEEMMNKVLGYVDIGVKQGANLACGGKRFGNEGYFIEPTIFTEVTENMRIAQEEIFGPVMSVLKFSSLEEVIDRANDVEYGLAAGVLTNDINKATKFANI